MERDIFTKNPDACRNSFPVGRPSGKGYFLRLYREDKMSSSVPLKPEYNVWCQMKCSLDNNEHAICKLYLGGAVDLGAKHAQQICIWYSRQD